MKQVRIVATVLFYLTRILSVAYLATALHSLLTFAFKTTSLSFVENGKYFEVLFPFTRAPFLRGDNNTFYIIEMIAFIALYGIFFWLVGNIFQTFREKKLLTSTGVKRLQLFYLVNFLVPLIFLIIHIAIAYEVSVAVILTFLHAVLGVFAYFMAAIFSQGLKLQNEQDLFF